MKVKSLKIEEVIRDKLLKALSDGKKNGKSQSDLANFVGISRQAVNDMCTGKTKKPSTEHVAKMCIYFGKPLSWLVPYADENFDYEKLFRIVMSSHMSLKMQKRLDKVESRDFAEMILELYMRNEKEDEIITRSRTKEISANVG